jgi:MFS family permease
VLGGWLADLRGFKFMIFIGALLYLVATIIRLIMARHAAQTQITPTEKMTFAGLKTNLSSMFALMTAGGIVTWILITDGVRDVSFSLSFDFMPIFMQDIVGLSKTQIGLMSSLFGIMMMVSMYPGGVLADKKGERFGITIAFFMQFIAIGLIAVLPKQNIWTSIVGWSIAGLSVGLMAPAYQSLISKAVPANLRGTAFGLFNTSLGIISLPAPWIGAQLWEQISPRFPFGITAIALFLAGFIALLKFKIDKPNDPSQTLE